MLLSVIIPFYNASSTLPAALESILKQGDVSYAEFIFIDDGSSDNSNQLIERFADKHPNLNISIVSHSENRGVSAAVATGLKAAAGTFVTRLDADDIFLPKALGLMCSRTQDDDYDIVCSSFILDRKNKKPKLIPFPDCSANLNRLPIDTVSFSLSGKLIRQSLLIDNDITTIPGIDCWEDLFVTARAFALAGNVSVIPQPTFRYYVDPEIESASRRPKEIVLKDRIKYAEALERWLADQGIKDEFRPFIDRLKFMAKIKYLRLPHPDIGKWIDTFPEINQRILRLTKVPYWVKIAAKAIVLMYPK